jgi:hypothetical protein
MNSYLKEISDFAKSSESLVSKLLSENQKAFENLPKEDAIKYAHALENARPILSNGIMDLQRVMKEIEKLGK